MYGGGFMRRELTAIGQNMPYKIRNTLYNRFLFAVFKIIYLSNQVLYLIQISFILMICLIYLFNV